MGLLRTAAIVGICVALMPADRAEQERLYKKASTAAHWTITFCDRNAVTCQKAQHLWSAFLDKAAFAASMAYDIAFNAPPELESDSSKRSFRTGIDSPARDDTLTPFDLQPHWRGHERRHGI